ncbi:MAG: cellulase family glycosylhydrolase [Anaerolineae bacterium]|nr:cellulase family glycosylhydrolase [Anaerolineae bacterium]MDW8170971.1 cellulase family glycosylhydrolase [Anaerolineae bacterium]
MRFSVWLATWVLATMLVGCNSQLEPVRIVITPTPSNAVVQVATESPTPEVPSQTPIPMQIVQESTSAPTLATPSATPSPTSTPEPSWTPIPGDGTYIGSILSGAVSLPQSVPTVEPLPVTQTTVPSPTSPIAISQPEVSAVVAPVLDSAQMGVQVYYNMSLDDFGQVVFLVNQMRFGWIKFQVNWAFWQPGGPEEVNERFLTFEQSIQLAKNRGLRVILSVAKAPSWARSIQEEDGPPDDPQALANFMRLLIQRVKPENIDAIEIWNEPNLAREWRGTLPFNGAGYMQLFRPSYDVIRQEAPQTLILTAGLAPTGDSPVSVNDRDFLQQMFDNGLSNYEFVGVGIHPYGWANPPDALCCDMSGARGWDDDPHFFFLNNLNDYREILVRNGYADRQLWVTEFGWPSWQGFPNDPPELWLGELSLEQQAQYVLRAFQIGQEREDIGPMILWNFNFANAEMIESRNEIAAYSIFVPNFGPGDPLFKRPLYDALINRP